MLKPLYDTHSIQSISLICEFSGDVEPSALEVIRKESTRISNRLQHRRFRRKSSSHLNEDILGYMFYNKKPSGEENEIFEINGSRASFTSNSYVNFQSFISDSMYHLELANHAFRESGHNANRLILNYEDAFTSDVINWEPSESLQLDTPYIARACIQKGDFWHSSSGFFSEKNFEGDFLLHNLIVKHNVIQNKEDDSNTYILSLSFFHVLDIKSPIEASQFKDYLLRATNFLRDQNRELLRGILSKDLAARIGL